MSTSSKWLFPLLLLAVSVPVNAAPATRLVVNCAPFVVPPPATHCFNHAVGEPFKFWVVAVDASGQLATGYDGAVQISSSDPAATLPPDHTFTSADGSLFRFNFTFHSVTSGSNPSLETITATDSANGLSGTRDFNIFAEVAPFPLPTSSALSLLLLATILGLVGFQSLGRISIDEIASGFGAGKN